MITTVNAHENFYRQLVGAGHENDFDSGLAGDNYLRPAGRPDYSAEKGTMMPRGGSIVGLSLLVNVSAWASTADATARVRVNDTEVFTAAVSVTSTGVFKAWETQAAGVDTFDAGDLIQVTFSIGGGIDDNSAQPCILVELEMDNGRVVELGEDGYQRQQRATPGVVEVA